ncbi:hypothetical protein LSH36_299g02000 [Paralvinella palmiformis]|uniref:Uncharacterized protein n=1 Tax=Paralvinella palmiformis TaxID=53620 RepID=A0AAD9JI22_9ANNE|nr:hypothetical protein LSH36_299g02000 [Paralvinella palmiformis]
MRCQCIIIEPSFDPSIFQGRGTSFPYRVRVKDWTVTCKQDDVTRNDIKGKCCLPQEKHLVCYGIRVEGSKLNFSNETSSYLTTTDFSDLCKHMVEAEDRKPGLYNSATFLPGGGELSFRYGVWSEVARGSERHIDNIACGVSD